MKRLLVLSGCVIVLLALAGCGRQNRKTSNPLPSAGQKNIFPEVMVGVWEAEVSEISKWGIKFEPDGSILKIIHSLAGPVKLSEGGVYMEGPDPNTFAYFAIGPCEAKYNPTNRQLSVKIFLDAFHMRLPQGDLEGRNEDYFDGPVSDDGRTWTVSWRSYSWLDGASPPDPNEIEANPDKLTFTKLDIKSSPPKGN
jgi:hypothetical protein